MIEVKALVGELAPLIRDMVREEIQRLVQPQAAHGYAVQPGLLSRIEVAHMGEVMDKLFAARGQAGTIKHGHKTNKDVRDSRVCFVNAYAENPELDVKDKALVQSVFIRLVGLAHVTQATTLAGEVAPLASYPKEQMQFSEYGEGQFYSAHQDADGDNVEQRALSMSVIIEAAEAGGAFKFRDVDVRPEHEEMADLQGSALVFSSGAFHEVTPVTKGRRRSIVFWLNRAVPLAAKAAA